MAMPGGPPPQLVPVATISIVDVFAKVVEMQVELGKINEKLADLPDHEARIRVLETARAKIYGACLALSAIAGGGAAWVTLALSRR